VRLYAPILGSHQGKKISNCRSQGWSKRLHQWGSSGLCRITEGLKPAGYETRCLGDFAVQDRGGDREGFTIGKSHYGTTEREERI